MDRVQEKNIDREVPAGRKPDDLYDLIDGLDVCLMTTRRPEGHLVTRPMAVQERANGVDLWFVTNIESEKLDELAQDPHVNLGFYKESTREWVSVSGTAKLSQDPALIRALHSPSWRIWFAKDDKGHDGGVDDPRIALVLVQAHTVIYSKQDRARPLVLFEMAKSMVTGDAPKLSDIRKVNEHELPKDGGAGA